MSMGYIICGKSRHCAISAAEDDDIDGRGLEEKLSLPASVIENTSNMDDPFGSGIGM